MTYAQIRIRLPGTGKSRPRSRDRQQIIASLRKRDGDSCWLCENPIDFTLPRDHREAGTIDHVVPFSEGGLNRLQNFKLAHQICNETRGRMTEKRK